jgi:methionine-rich copper-binding protein CopC
MRLLSDSRSRAILAAACLLLFAAPAAVDGHAELVTAVPKDGAALVGGPAEISARYSEPMTAKGSSLVLLDASSTVLATGGVDPQDISRMGISPLPALPVGTYTVRSTTVSKADGDVDRASWTFTVVALAPSATPTPTPVCTDECNGYTSGGELISPTATVPATTTGAQAAATPTPSGTGGATAASTGDVIIPIVAGPAIVGGAALWLSRRRRA